MAVQWGHLKSAPDSIFKFVSCSCKKSECATNHCSCAAVNLPWTDLCCCTNCKNNDSPERVDNEIFNDDDTFGEYQDGDTDGEVDDSSDSSEDELFEDDEIDND